MNSSIEVAQLLKIIWSSRRGQTLSLQTAELNANMIPTNSELKLIKLRNVDIIIDSLVISQLLLSTYVAYYDSSYRDSNWWQAVIPGEVCWQLQSTSDNLQTNTTPPDLGSTPQEDDDIIFQDDNVSFDTNYSSRRDNTTSIKGHSIPAADDPSRDSRTLQDRTTSTTLTGRSHTKKPSRDFPGQYSFQITLTQSHGEEQQTTKKDVYGNIANQFTEPDSASLPSLYDEPSFSYQSEDDSATVQEVENRETCF